MSSRETPGRAFEAVVHARQRIRLVHWVLAAAASFSLWNAAPIPHFNAFSRGAGWILIVLSILGWGPYLISWVYSRPLLDGNSRAVIPSAWARFCNSDCRRPLSKYLCLSGQATGLARFCRGYVIVSGIGEVEFHNLASHLKVCLLTIVSSDSRAAASWAKLTSIKLPVAEVRRGSRDTGQIPSCYSRRTARRGNSQCPERLSVAVIRKTSHRSHSSADFPLCQCLTNLESSGLLCVSGRKESAHVIGQFCRILLRR